MVDGDINLPGKTMFSLFIMVDGDINLPEERCPPATPFQEGLLTQYGFITDSIHNG